MTNPNNCMTCRYNHMRGQEDTAEQHCYMFANEPTDVCMQHTRPVFIDYITSLVPPSSVQTEGDVEWVLRRARNFRS